MLALVVIMVWIALRRGLKSIVRLRDQVRGPHAGLPGAARSGARSRRSCSPWWGPSTATCSGWTARWRRRSRFIANASHQLRTPFTVLQTQVDFGLKTLDPAQNTRRRRRRTP